MSVSPAFIEHVSDCLAGLGDLSFRKMFGGAGIYASGLMFGMIDDDVLYFKADAATRREFESEGTAPFTYMTKHGRGTLMSYWRVPERLFDDPDEMVLWARTALAVARAAAAKAKPKSGPKARKAKTPPRAG